MTTLNTIIEEEKKEFDEEIERLEEIFFDEDGYDKVKLYLKSEKNTLFASTIYPETFYELDQEKVKNFLTTAMQRAYEAGRKDWLRSEIEKLERMKIKLPTRPENGESLDAYYSYMNNATSYNTALTSIITRYKEELLELDKK